MNGFIRTSERVWLGISVFMLVVMVITVLCQVLFRYLLSFPLAWTEELSRLALILSVYAALPAAYVRGEHIAVDFFVRLIPGRAALAYIVVLKAITFLVLAYFAWGAFLQMQATWKMTFISLPTLPIGSMYLVEGLSLAYFALLVLVTWRDPEVYHPTQHEGMDA
ncbi:TRAP transporter small permease [Pseudooceanicola sp. LIPI14-2-Ac024]|uniref:TRAP transporter small permease n=1 Tax=Pseudooceanicola sp. LIPI14-2-Ac024 TaxID=3344875 RepID=UPI0035D0F2F6